MISKKKIRMMTQAAIYEKRYYRRDAFVQRYYKSDYIGMERLKSKIWLTIFYGISLVAYMFDQVYNQAVDLLHYDYQGFVIKAVLIYLALGVVISIITSSVYGPRYDKANRRIDAYYRQIDKINTME